ncbi:hypothetical protein HanIR_Chr15g0743991 [Helianthus annuus]|nr:hypothetical protein HanIR_Chr15g0743991 [Helianthus annuus]
MAIAGFRCQKGSLGRFTFWLKIGNFFIQAKSTKKIVLRLQACVPASN